MIGVAEATFVDTNILLAATDEARREHDAARRLLDNARAGRVCVSPQVLREYLVVATRPVEQNGLGLAQTDAVANVRALRERLVLLEETRPVLERLHGLLTEVSCIGKQVHDANLVATMLVHGVLRLITINIDDFRRFDALIEVAAPV